MALDKFHPVDVPVWGEIGITARRLAKSLPSDLTFIDQHSDLQIRCSLWWEEKQRRVNRLSGNGINSARIFSVLSRECPENAVIAVDVGNNTYSFG